MPTRRTRTRTRTLAAGTALLLPLLAAAPARAATTPRVCTAGETVIGTAVPGLRDAGTTCTVLSVAVGADGVVADGATAALTVQNSSSAGGVAALDGAALTVSGSTLEGDDADADDAVNVDDASTVTITHSALTGDVNAAAEYAQDHHGEGTAVAFTLADSTLDGTMEMDAVKTLISDDLISGGVYQHDGDVIVEHTHIGGNAAFQDGGSLQMCGVHVLGDMYVTDAGATLGASDDPRRSCGAHPTVRVDGTLDIEFSTTPVHLAHVVVHGDLVCAENAVAPVLEDVTVTGRRTGQCA